MRCTLETSPTNVMIFEQNTFDGGSDLISSDVAIAGNAYQWIVNARNRFGNVEPINEPIEQTRLATGKKQGIVSVGGAVIAFVAGEAYYKPLGGSNWLKIPTFLMSTTADTIWAQTVPVAAATYMRKLNSSGSTNDKIVIDHNTLINGMPSGVVCQDGINQPWLITYNDTYDVFTARLLKSYATWNSTSPEYVPIGRQMMYLNGKLFIVSPNGQSVYQSVTGQPLNFMVNIDANGNKASVNEAEGGAATTSFAFDYNEITCLQPVNVADSFIYGTATNVRVITLNYDLTIFGEPLYTQSAIIDTGIIEQDALVEINGDYAFGNYEGLRDFNAVQQMKFEGRNTVFSRGVSKLFKGIRQTGVVAVSFDNYALFACTTVVGEVIVVFDSILGKWVGFDMFNIGKITGFAIVDLPTEAHLYVCTDTNKIYELYSSVADTSVPFLYTRAFSAIDGENANAEVPVTDIKSQKLDLIFTRGSSGGNATVTEVVDGVQCSTLEKPIAITETEVPYVELPALQPLITTQGERITFNFSSTARGYKIAYVITWDTSASLQKIRLITTDINQRVAATQHSSAIGTKQL